QFSLVCVSCGGKFVSMGTPKPNFETTELDRSFPQPCTKSSSLQCLKLFVKPLAKALGRLKHPSVPHQSNDISGAVEYGSAVRTDFKMRFHSLAHLGRTLGLGVIGVFPPYFYATYFNGRHCFSPGSSLPIRLSFNPETVNSRSELVSHC